MMLVSIDDDDDDAGDDIILWKKLDQLLRPILGALFQSLDSESGPDGAPDHNHVSHGDDDEDDEDDADDEILWEKI